MNWGQFKIWHGAGSREIRLPVAFLIFYPKTLKKRHIFFCRGDINVITVSKQRDLCHKNALFIYRVLFIAVFWKGLMWRLILIDIYIAYQRYLHKVIHSLVFISFVDFFLPCRALPLKSYNWILTSSVFLKNLVTKLIGTCMKCWEDFLRYFLNWQLKLWNFNFRS